LNAPGKLRHSVNDRLAICTRIGATALADERSSAVGNTPEGEGFGMDVIRILRTSSAVAGAKVDWTELSYFLTAKIRPSTNFRALAIDC
jgi:hypothetical protein